MGIAFFWLGLAIIVGVAADKRGRNGFVWFGMAAIFSPILVGLLLLVMGYNEGPVLLIDGGAEHEPMSVGSSIVVAVVLLSGFGFLIYMWG